MAKKSDRGSCGWTAAARPTRSGEFELAQKIAADIADMAAFIGIRACTASPI